MGPDSYLHGVGYLIPEIPGMEESAHHFYDTSCHMLPIRDVSVHWEIDHKLPPAVWLSSHNLWEGRPESRICNGVIRRVPEVQWVHTLILHGERRPNYEKQRICGQQSNNNIIQAFYFSKCFTNVPHFLDIYWVSSSVSLPRSFFSMLAFSRNVSSS